MKNQFGSLREFVAEVERRESQKEDFIASAGSLYMSGNNTISLGSGTAGGQSGQFSVGSIFHGQLATYLDIPKPYYDRIGSVPGLREYNVNTLLRGRDDKRLVRTLDGEARALLSDRYKPIDNFFVLNSFLPTVMNDFKDVKVNANALSQSKMYVQITFPSLTKEVQVGDAVQYGITLSNSEVGFGVYNVEEWIWRLSCMNGAIFSSLMKKRHIGRRIGDDEGDYSVYKSDTIEAEMKSLQLRIRDIMSNAISEGNFSMIVDKLKSAGNDKVSKPVEVIEKVTQRFGLSQNDAAAILNNMEEEKNFNRYGLFNGITALAKAVDDYDKAYAYEKAGAAIIELSKSEWKAITEEAA